MIECQICKRLLGNLVGKHLKSHGLSSAQYQELYPGHPVSAMKPWSDELRARHIQLRTGRTHSEETKQKIGAKHKGKKRGEDEIAKWRDSYQKFLEENGGSPQKGYKRSDEFKARMREVAQNRPPELVQQKVEQMWEARRGQKMTDEQKEVYSAARVKFMIENPDSLGPKKLFNTKPELQFEEELKLRAVRYKKSVHIGGYLYDFLINDIAVIEIDGPYHYEPNMYGSKNDSMDKKLEGLRKTQEKDAKKTQRANEHGYDIYRIRVGGSLPEDWYSQLLCQNFDLF